MVEILQRSVVNDDKQWLMTTQERNEVGLTMYREELGGFNDDDDDD